MRENPRIGSYEYYERLYEIEEKHWWYMGIREAAAGILNSHYRGMKNLSILDTGCGTGFTLTWLERYSWLQTGGRSRHFMECLSLLSEARTATSFPGLHNGLPFKSDFFDLVLCKGVIQHLRGNGSDQVALREFHRVLRPGGCLLLLKNSSQGIGKGAKPADENLGCTVSMRCGARFGKWVFISLN